MLLGRGSLQAAKQEMGRTYGITGKLGDFRPQGDAQRGGGDFLECPFVKRFPSLIFDFSELFSLEL